MRHLSRVRAEPEGQFTAEAVGIPEARATAATKLAAVQQVTAMLDQLVTSGQLFVADVQDPNPLLLWGGWAKDDPDYEEYLQDINVSADHLLALINDILDLSKVEAGQVELEVAPFSLREALERLGITTGSKPETLFEGE